jgi:hypothetical protein
LLKFRNPTPIDMRQTERKWRKRKAKENNKRTVNEKRKEKSQPGGSLHFGLKNQKEWRMADHNGSTDLSITPLPGVLDTNHHVSMYVHVYPDACLGQERNPS